MTYNYKNAIIRRPNKSIQNGLSSKNLHPQYEIIVEEHTNYAKAINDAGLKINLLDPLEEYPDSIFVEDPAIIYKSNIIILNPADRSRNGEKNIIKNEVKHLFDNILFVESGFRLKSILAPYFYPYYFLCHTPKIPTSKLITSYCIYI